MATPNYVISLGSLSIPVEVTPAARDAVGGVRFRTLHRACAEAGRGGEAGQRTYCKTCGLDLGRDDLVKGVPAGRGAWALIEPAALEALDVEPCTVMEVRTFVRLGDVDPVYLGASSWLTPLDAAAAKAYTLLRAAMRRRKRAAIVRYVRAQRDRVGLVRPLSTALMLHELWPAEEIQPPPPWQPAELAEAELALAEGLVAAAEGRFDPRAFHDRRGQQVRALVAAALEDPVVTVAPSSALPAAMPDLMAALQQSVAALKARGQGAATRTRKPEPRQPVAAEAD